MFDATGGVGITDFVCENSAGTLYRIEVTPEGVPCQGRFSIMLKNNLDKDGQVDP